MFVELTEAAGESRNPIRRIIGGLGEVVWAQWDEVRHAAALLVAGLAAFRRGKFRERRRETFLVPNCVERRASGRLHLAGIPRAITMIG